MELIKLYQGRNNHTLAVHRNKEGRLCLTDTIRGRHKVPGVRRATAGFYLDSIESVIMRRPDLEYKPVPLLVSHFDGNRRCFETPDDLDRYYSGLGIDTARVVDLLNQGVPVIFGKLIAYREKPWNYTQGITHQFYGVGKRSVF